MTLETNELRVLFDLYEPDGNDTIPMSALGPILRALGQNPTEEELKAIANLVDPNNTGRFAYSKSSLLTESNLMKDEKQEIEALREAFKLFDLNNDGSVDKEELRKVLASKGDVLDEAEITEMFNLVDANKDGRLSYDEFVNLFSPVRLAL